MIRGRSSPMRPVVPRINVTRQRDLSSLFSMAGFYFRNIRFRFVAEAGTREIEHFILIDWVSVPPSREGIALERALQEGQTNNLVNDIPLLGLEFLPKMDIL